MIFCGDKYDMCRDEYYIIQNSEKVSGISARAVWSPRRASARRPARAKTLAFKRTDAKIVLHIFTADFFLAFSVFMVTFR